MFCLPKPPLRHWSIIPVIIFSLAIALQAHGARSAANFNLLNLEEQNTELYRAPGKAVVLFFTGNGCPIARKSAPQLRTLQEQFGKEGVTFWVVNSYSGDRPGEIREERRKLKLQSFNWLLDSKQAVALSFGIDRTAEVVALDTKLFEVFYQGAIDDRYSEGAERPAASETYLKDALQAFLAGKPVETTRTRSAGCRIAYDRVGGADGVPDYTTDIAPLLQKHCVDCHRKDGIGPWSMNSHRRVANYGDMIEEVLLTRRMPPWDPHPEYGNFVNEHRLSREETQSLLRWIQAGSPRGEGSDPLEEPLPPLPDWPLGNPDKVLALPEEQQIPPTGVLDYRYLEVDSPFTNEVWLSGMDIKPGNRKVVHHVILYAKWPDGPDDGGGIGTFFVGWAPGASPLKYPDGVAKRLPANAKLTIEMHYTTCGTPETDRSEIAFYLADGRQERQAETRSAGVYHLDIPAGHPEAAHLATYHFDRPATIYGLFPHMHFRGKWMRYELLFPNGRRETLLHVPRYDFQWQLSYYLEAPRHVPAGTWMLVTGAFDNSEENPANPDPHKRIAFGLQSWDEMFIGFFEAADDPQPAQQAKVEQ